ncbi:MAG: dienelactone hydrolase family protein [Deltaproteobacteria bacterium]|nr:dienelactone hydrolase family protein [Deltaproteobacteria bacterium]
MQIELASKGDRIRGEYVVSDAGSPRPGVLVLHDGRGFSEHVVGVAHELAEQGYAALAVDLYSRGRPAPDIENADLKAFMRAVPDEQIVGDVQAAIDFLAADRAVGGLPIGLVGYCWGGACGFLAAGHCTGLAAVASWYGELRTEVLNARHPEHPMDALLARQCPVIALFAELDPYVALPHVDALRARHAAAPGDRGLEIVVYPGVGHGFAHRGRDHFDAPCHDDGWARIKKLFDRELGRA